MLRCSFDHAAVAGLYVGWGWINTVSGSWATGNGLVGMHVGMFPRWDFLAIRLGYSSL
jgi:hypothetical protein